MIFTRTESGLKNIHKFHGVDVMVYIEGKESENKFDKKFYETILKRFSPLKKYKINPVGNCSNVLDIYSIIINDGNNNSICFIDRDYSNLKFSYIYDERLKFTCGYSWENDFWSDNLIIDCVDYLSGGRLREVNFNIPDLINRTKLQAYKICCLELVCQLYDIALLNKRTATFGLSIERDSMNNIMISRSEKLRLKNKAPFNEIIKCPISRSLYRSAWKLENNKIIQGHFWEILALNFVKVSLDSIFDKSSISFDYIKNIARSLFVNNIDKYIDESVKSYYIEELKSI